MQQHSKGKVKASEPLVCNQCVEHGLECKLRPGKSTLCTKCHEVKVKCKQPDEEKPERMHKWTQAEKPEAGPSGSKRLGKTSEKRSDRVTELVEVLGAGLKAIIDAFNK